MKKIAIIPNLNKDIGLVHTRSVADILKAKAVVYMQSQYAQSGIEAEFLDCDELFKAVDLAIVLGGDGTILSVIQQLSILDKPVLGINLGRLGFMTEIEINNLNDLLNKLISDDYKIEERMMIKATVYRDNKPIANEYALNDIVVSRASFSRLVNVTVYCDDELINTYVADGIVIATPTGSTAYSLSAGGPIVDPCVNVIIATPICPHTLSSRSIITSENKTIRLVLGKKHQHEAMLTADGQRGVSLEAGDVIEIKKSSYKARLVRLSGKSFYDVLRHKLTQRGVKSL